MKHHLKPLAACMAALFSSAAFNAHAAPPAPPPVQNPSGAGTGAGAGTPAVAVPPTMEPKPTVALFPAPPKEFPGIPWGSFLAYPDVTLSITHDDNIYAQRTYHIDDVIYTLSPSLELKSSWTRHELNFDLGGDFDRYREHDSENVNDYWAGFDGRYDFSPATNLFGGARYSRDHEDRSTPGELNPLLQAEPTQYDHGEAHLGVAHSTGAWRMRLGGTWDRYDYLDGVSLLGATVDQDYRDHDLTSLGVRLGYVLSPQYEVFGQYASDAREYENVITAQAFNRDSDGYRVAGGVRFTLAPQRLAGEVFAGVMRQDYDYSGFDDVSKPYFGALAVWKPSPQATVTGFIDRSLVETTVYSGADYASSSLDTTYGFEVERRLSSNLSVSGRAAYTKSDFQSYERSDSVVDAGAGVRYYVAPTVFIGADLSVIDRDSSELNAQYSSNQVMFNVGYTPARNRDYAIIPEQEAGAAEAPRTLGLYSGFYAGLQLGYGGLTTATWGPRDGGGFDDADMGGFGGSYGVFAGWGTELDNWYLGIEVDGGDSDASWYHDKDTAATVSVDKGTSYGVNLRAGYQLDGGLLTATLGMVSTDFETYYQKSDLPGVFAQSDSETGTRIGLGLDIPASRNLFVRTAYSYTRFDDYDATYQSDDAPVAYTTDSFETSESVFSLGLGWRFGDDRPEPPARAAADTNGLYLGASLGHGTVGSELTGTHNVGAGDYAFYGDFANSGFTGGFFAGYGTTFDRVYVGLELDTEAANFGWYHERNTGGGGGRDFGVEKRGSYGAGLRLGYVLNNGALLYGRIGAVQTRFNTLYDRGNNPATAVDRSDDLNGTRFGLGAEIPASQNSFVRMDYSYTDYGDAVDFVTTQGVGPDAMRFETSESLVRLGLGVRF